MVNLDEVLQEAKEKEHLTVIELYEISLRTGKAYICNTDKDIIFEGHKYISVPLEREEISQSTDNIDDSMKIKMSDATTEQLQYIIAGFDFRGCTVRVRQILYPESLNDNAISREVFYGYIDNPAYENGEFSCTLRSRIHKVTVPRRTYQTMCNSQFGDEICQMDKARQSGKLAKIIQSSTLIIDITKEDNYWNNGIMTIEGESRMIRKSEGNKIYTYYPFFAKLTEGQTYTIERGCDKTATNCGKYNNLDRFTGFPSIPFEDIYR